MNRRIKFRYWNRNLKKMFGPFDIYDLMDNDGSMGKANELQQFVGFCDKNGTEIYEGDIMKVDAGRKEIVNQIFSVVFHEGSFCLSIGPEIYQIVSFIGYADQTMDQIGNRDIQPFIEVIGDIHQHPHLLTA